MFQLRWVSDFQGALTVSVLLDYFELFQELENVELQPGVPDKHIWRLSPSGRFSSKTAYMAMFQGSIPFQPAERVWKTWAPNKCKFFLWLVEHKCWTADRLAKRGMDCLEQCPLCDQQPETINHLLTTCVFARQFWASLFQPMGMLNLVPQPTDEVFEDLWCTSSSRIQDQLRKGFNSLVMLGAWVLWKHRNSCVFNVVVPSVPATLLVAREEALLWSMAGAKGLSLLQAIGAPGV
jgi:hypothetical protein